MAVREVNLPQVFIIFDAINVDESRVDWVLAHTHAEAKGCEFVSNAGL